MERRKSPFYRFFKGYEPPRGELQTTFEKARVRQRSLLSSSADRPYVYPKLESKGQIRLLRLPTEPEHKPNMRHCSFVYVNISDPPPYTAVSYAWDPSGTPRSVTVDFQNLSIQNTVYWLLSGLGKGAAGGSRLIWIDAICINQSDTKERNEQVSLMSEIYLRANYVIAWIFSPSSPANDELDIGLKYIRDLALDRDTLHKSHMKKSSLEVVLNDRYWTRLWILQEVTLARTVILKSPEIEIPFAMLGRLFDNISRPSGAMEKIHTLSGKDLEVFSACPAKKVYDLRKKEYNADVATLRNLLTTCWSHQCGEIRDRIFALLSLSKKARLNFNVDYSIILVALVQQVIDFSIDFEDMPDLETVSHAMHVRLALRLDGFISPSRRYDIECWSRGTVLSLDLDLSPSSEDEIMRVRSAIDGVKSLRSFDFLKLDRSVRYHCYLSSDEAKSLNRSTSMTWSHDLCCFTFRRNGKVSVCLASCWVRVGDEVWQFPKTTRAILARPHAEGFSIVGRALILNEGELLRPSPHSTELATTSVWDDPGTNRHVRQLSVDFNCLMILTMLADHNI